MSVRIAPSILAADFARLADEMARAAAGGADCIHVDVMDGHFVPNITIGPPVVRSLKKATPLPLDVHLMIEAPDRYLEEFARAISSASRAKSAARIDGAIRTLIDSSRRSPVRRRRSEIPPGASAG